MHTHSENRLFVSVCSDLSEEVLGCAELEDLNHLVEETRFEAVRQGRLPDEPALLRARLDPIRRQSDAGFLTGIRATLQHEQMPGISFHLDFPNAIAAGCGGEIVRRLIAEGTLKEGDVYRVGLASIPRCAASSNGYLGESAPDVQVEEQPIPIRKEPLSAWGIGPEALAAADRDRPVFLARSLLEKAEAAAIRHGKLETGPLLLGNLIADESLQGGGVLLILGCRHDGAG